MIIAQENMEENLKNNLNEPEQNEVPEEEKKEKKIWPKVVALIILIIIIILLLLRSCSPDDGKPWFDPSQDENVTFEDPDKMTKEEIQEALNEKVAEGMINISMNTNPIFENGKSEGTMLIVNEDINRYPQVIEIYLADTEELIYRSGLIPVGARINTAKLDVDLEPGDYNCIAYFNNVDEETGEPLGKAAAEIVITILK